MAVSNELYTCHLTALHTGDKSGLQCDVYRVLRFGEAG
jgi:hypothetical protein